MIDLKKKRQQLLSFLLRHGRIFIGGKNWTKMHERWLAKQTFNHPAQQIVFQDHVEVINAAQVRLAALEQQLREIAPAWTMAPVVAAYQALRGVSFLVAVAFVAEVGDVRRFATPQQLMAFLGLVPSERTAGDTVRRGSITKTGNHRARLVLIEGAWTYRYPARVGETLPVACAPGRGMHCPVEASACAGADGAVNLPARVMGAGRRTRRRRSCHFRMR